MYQGIDISHWQGDIDYGAVHNDEQVDFVILKAGGSDSGFYEDSKFREYLDGFNSVGTPVLGAYYFVGQYCISYDDGVADADRLCDILDGTDIPYAILDLESTDPSDRDGATDASVGFMDRCVERGYKTMIYASDISGFQNRLNLDQLGDFKKWVARYGNEPQYVSDYIMWQYSSSGTVNGINVAVDMDYLTDESILDEIIGGNSDGYDDSDDDWDNGRTWTRQQAVDVTTGLYQGLLHRGFDAGSNGNDSENEYVCHGLEYAMTRVQAFESIRNSDEYTKKQLIVDCYMFMRGSMPSDEEIDGWFYCDENDIKNGILYSDEFNNRYNV